MPLAIEDKIYEYLDSTGIKKTNKGYRYLKEAIYMTILNRDLNCEEICLAIIEKDKHADTGRVITRTTRNIYNSMFYTIRAHYGDKLSVIEYIINGADYAERASKSVSKSIWKN